MKKKKISRRVRSTHNESYEWLPIERWLIPSLQFAHVHGLARIFLILEIGLSVSIVFGVLVLVILKFFS